MRRVLFVVCLGAALSGVAARPILKNNRFVVSLDGDSQRIEVTDERSRMRWHQVSLPSPKVFFAPILKERPLLDGRASGWDESGAVLTEKGNRFVLNISLKSRELYLYAEISNGWKLGSELEVWIGDSQITLMVGDEGAALSPGKYVELKRAPELFGNVSGNSCVLQAILPMENFGSLAGWAEDQRFIAVALNVRSPDGGFLERWPQGNEPDKLWSFAQASVSDETLSLFDPEVRSLKKKNGRLTFETDLCAMSRAGAVQVPAKVQLELSGNGVEQKIVPEPTSVVLHDLIWPCAFVLDEEESWTIYPNDSGMIVPTAVTHPQAVDEAWIYDGLIYDFNGTTSAGMGMVDRRSEDGPGFFSIVEPPWTAHYRSHRVRVDGTGYRVPFYYWFADQGKLEKEYTLTHCFTADGSYSALAKQYRKYLQEHGRFKSFREKLKEQPLNERVIGAPVFWFYSAMGPAAFVRMAEQMKSDGMDRAILNLDPYYYEMLGLHEHAKQMETAIKQMTNMGYVVSRYDQYRDTHPNVPGRIAYEQWNTGVYEKYALDYRGDKTPGFGRDSRVITPLVAAPLAEQSVAADIARYPYNARFFDCFGIISPYLDSDFRAGQETGVGQVQECRRRIFKAASSRGLLVGSEGGADWGLPLVSWAEGAMTLMPATWGEVPWWGADDENAHYKYQVDEVIRIPFLQLVAGDCANIAWRWDDGMDRKPQHWQKRNLLSVLYGGSPMFFINQDGFGALRPLIKYTYDYVCRWNQQIGDKEMLYHRSLSSDRSVQESCWQDNDAQLGVVVNFGSETYRVGTVEIPPMDYMIFREAGGKRVYREPAVPARSCDYRVDSFSDAVEGFECGFSTLLRSDFSPDRGQFCGVGSNAVDVISGRYSMVADNKNRKLPPFIFLKTRPSQIPLKAGMSYDVTFTYRAARSDHGTVLTCRMNKEQVFGRWPLAAGEQRSVSVSVAPDSEGSFLEWILTGTGRVSIDDVQITE